MTMSIFIKTRAFVMTVVLLLNVSLSVFAQNAPQSPQSQQSQYRVRVTSELVLVNVVVRDKKGNLVRDLKKEDFTVLEDNKRQEVSTFDFEDANELPPAGAGEGTVTGAAATGSLLRSSSQPAIDARDRR